VLVRANKDISKVDYFINGNYIGSANDAPFSFSFIPADNGLSSEKNELKAVVYDRVLNKGVGSASFRIIP